MALFYRSSGRQVSFICQVFVIWYGKDVRRTCTVVSHSHSFHTARALSQFREISKHTPGRCRELAVLGVIQQQKIVNSAALFISPSQKKQLLLHVIIYDNNCCFFYYYYLTHFFTINRYYTRLNFTKIIEAQTSHQNNNFIGMF